MTNHKNNRSIIIVALLVLSGLVLCGGRIKEKDISMSIEGLIDLDNAIFTSNLGVSNPNNAPKDSEADKKETDHETVKKKEETKVVVKGKKIYLNEGDNDISEASLLNHVKSIGENQTVYLKDGDINGYADAVVYKDINKKLFDLCDEIGAEYEPD